MLIATDALSVVFIVCFLFGLLFLLGTALLGNLGHAVLHSISHQAGIHIAGHAHAPQIGGSHAVGHGTHVTTHGPAHSTGQTASQVHRETHHYCLTSILPPSSSSCSGLAFSATSFIIRPI